MGKNVLGCTVSNYPFPNLNVQPLKFGNGWVISSCILLGTWLNLMLGFKVVRVGNNCPCSAPTWCNMYKRSWTESVMCGFWFCQTSLFSVFMVGQQRNTLPRSVSFVSRLCLEYSMLLMNCLPSLYTVNPSKYAHHSRFVVFYCDQA